MPSVEQLRALLAEPADGLPVVAPIDELIIRGRRRRRRHRAAVAVGTVATIAMVFVLAQPARNWLSRGRVQPATTTLALGRAISFQAATPGYSDQFLTVVGGVAVLAPLSGDSAADRRAAVFTVRPGLADSRCFSFELASAPGEYLRHYSFQLKAQPADGTGTFAGDATFCPESGHDGQGLSFASFNYPTRFLRHFNSRLWVASRGGALPSDSTHLWAEDTSWRLTAPLAN